MVLKKKKPTNNSLLLIIINKINWTTNYVHLIILINLKKTKNDKSYIITMWAYNLLCNGI